MSTTTLDRPVSDTVPSAGGAGPGIPFARLLRVEWGKATDTPAARWLLALVALSTIGLLLRPLLAAGTEQSLSSYLRFAAVGLGILLPVVSILTLTSEWSQRTVLATFTQEPRRARVVLAKVTVSALLAGAGAVFGALAAVAALGLAAASGRQVEVDVTAALFPEFLLFVLLNVFTGVAIGALLHNSAAAVVVYFVLPSAFALLGRPVAFIAEWVDSTAAFDWLSRGQGSGHWAQISVSVVLWIAIPLTAGLVRTVRREIT